MHIQDYTGDPEALIDAAFALAAYRKEPTPDVAARVVGDTARKRFVENLGAAVSDALCEAISMYEINNGDYGSWPEGPDGERSRSEYESGLDDAVEEALEPWAAHLSADWLGRMTVDTGLWASTDEDRTLVVQFGQSAAKEIYKQLGADKTPNQMLASAGVTLALIETKMQQHAQGGAPMSDTATSVSDVIVKVRAHVGASFDMLAVYEDFETLLEEDDEILAGSAAGRLGLNADDMQTLQVASLSMDDAANDFVEMVRDQKEPSKRGRPARTEKAAATEARANGDALTPDVFDALKHCGAGDTAMAEALGVSRSTYTNYVKGKSVLVPEREQYDVLRTEIVDRTNRLLAALAALDGTEAQEIS